MASRKFGCFLKLGVAVTGCCIVPKRDELNYKFGGVSDLKIWQTLFKGTRTSFRGV